MLRRALVAFAVALSVLGAPPAPVGAQEAEPVGTPTVANERYVRRLLFDLHDDADPELDTVALGISLFFGGAGNPRTIALSMQGTAEGRGATVDGLFAALLRRPAEPAARTFFMERLSRIGRLKVAADLTASAEYASRQGRGTEAGWVDALFRDALGRPADGPSKAYFVQQRQAGRSRGSIASAVTGGSEGRRTVVGRLQRELLRRAPDAGGVAFYADRLGAGWSVEQVVREIVLSAEYRSAALAVPAAREVVLLVGGDRLVFTDTEGRAGRTLVVSGLADGEELVAIDDDPRSGRIYALTNRGRVRAITSDGTADPTPVPGAVPLLTPGAIGGMDFTPVSGALVLTDGAGEVAIRSIEGEPFECRLTFAYQPGALHAGRTPSVRSIASTQVTPSPFSWDTIGLDAATASLVRIGPGGALVALGPLHLDSAVSGFDLSQDGGLAVAVFAAAHAGPGLYVLDVRSGEPRLLAALDVDDVRGVAFTGRPFTEDGRTLFVMPGGTTTRNGRVVSGTDGPPLLPTVPPAATITGLTPGTAVVAVDQRPSDGTTYALGSDGQVYALGPETGDPPARAASTVGTPLPGFVLADGADIEADPVTDTLRVVNGDRLWRVRPSDGALVGDGATPGTARPLTYAAGDPGAGSTPRIGGLAHTNSRRSAPAPAVSGLYGIDEGRRAVVRIDPATGSVLTIGELDVADLDDVGGFDVEGRTGQGAYAILTSGGVQTLVMLDLGTGAAAISLDLVGTAGAPFAAFALIGD